MFEINGNPWYETLPFLNGALFLLVTLSSRLRHSVRPIFDPAALVFAFAEGMSLVMLCICAGALAFNKPFAMALITNNPKTFVTAMIFASIAIVREFLDTWSGRHG